MMQFEVLHRSKKKRLMIIGCFLVLILTAVVLSFTFAKYKVTKTLTLASGTVNYSKADLNLVAIYLEKTSPAGQYDSTDTVPGSGYLLNTSKSYCEVSDSKDSSITIAYVSGKLNFSGLTKRGTKCYAYFDVIRDTTKPVISNVTSSVTKTSITVNVTATDNEGVAKYFYSINNGNYSESTSSSHTFNGLTAGTSYTIKVKVTDTSGNESDINTSSIKTESDKVGDVILANYKTQTKRTNFTTTVTNTTTGTIYYEDTSDGRTYYFAGNPTDNWVKFAGFYWRIIRINEDGSIRMIYQGTSANTTGTNTQINTSAFNSSYNNNMYVGYMYTSNQVHGLGTSSTIKGVLDNWYSSNLSSYASKIDGNAGFCGDRQPSTSSSTSNGSGGTGTTTTYYGAYVRLVNKTKPTFECTNDSDLYTTSGSAKGNKALTYPIGLITLDEAWYAGGYTSNNSSYYLYTNQYYWTMSPYYFYSGWAFVFHVNSNGYLGARGVNGVDGVRPVINLKASVTISSGSGTSSSPYVIS